MARPDTYSRNQMIAHWLVVLFVLCQFLLHRSMERAYEEALEVGAFPLDGGAIMHAFGGLAVLTLMIWRLTMRLRRGAPPPPESEPGWMQIISRGNHYAFYVVLIAMPIFGAAAVATLIPWLGTAHEWAGIVLLVLIALHISGAVLHMIRPRSTAWQRMLRPDSPSRP